MPNAKIYSDCSSELLVDIIADLESALYGEINNNINGLFTFSYRHWEGHFMHWPLATPQNLSLKA
jgi:hypothetical protein